MHFAYATLPLRAIFHISCKSQHQLQSQSQHQQQSTSPFLSPFQCLSHPHSQSHFERQCMSEFGCTYACVLDMVLALINWRGVRLQQLLLLLLLLFSSSCSSLWESHERFAQCQCLSKYSAAFAEDLYNQVI